MKSKPLQSSFPSPLCLPAQQTELARPVLVHDDPQREGDGREQEGANREGQVQHLVLFFADQPAIHPQGPLRGNQGLHLNSVSRAEHGAVIIKVLHLGGRLRRRWCGQVEAGAVGV